MTTTVPFVAGVATCGGVGAGWVWNVTVQVQDGVSSQTFTVKVAGNTVATLTGSAPYGPISLVGTDTLTVSASGGSSGQFVTLTGDVQPYTVPLNPEYQNLIAPLVLPAEVGKPLTTQGGNTLDDGAGNMQGPGGGGSGVVTFGQLIASIGNLDGIYNRAGNGPPNFPDAVQINGASHCFSGAGAPTIAGTAGDFFFRTDTPTTTDQRIYVCTVTGAAGAATWVGIV